MDPPPHPYVLNVPMSARRVLLFALTLVTLFFSSITGIVASFPSRGTFGFTEKDFLHVAERNGFPTARDFFSNHVLASKPLVMKGAAKMSPAYDLWQSDDYFLKLDIPEDELVTVETMKKENRTQEILDINFRQFLETYREMDRYMVHRLPFYLGRDVYIPQPLQCPDVYEKSIVDVIMWFSSGGTKSVVHTDFVDNLNCLYDGDKDFILVDPKKYADQVFFDHPEGAYSGIDVDNVDYVKYKGLLSVEYYHVHLTAGDCIYIPYKWIHQVRSGGSRNIALNIWWDTHRNKDIDFSLCTKELDASLTLDQVDFITFSDVMQSLDAIRDQYADFTRHMNLSLLKFININVGVRDMQALGAGIGYTIPLKQIFTRIDTDEDGFMTNDEVKSLSKKDLGFIHKQLERFNTIMAALEERWARQREEYEEDGEHDEL